MNVLEEITRTQLETICRVMIKRIAKGFTAEQLSFLIGKEDNYIRSVEMLDEPSYSISELERIALALEETNFKSFFPRVHDESEIIVGVESHNDGYSVVKVISLLMTMGQTNLFLPLRKMFLKISGKIC